MASTYPATLDAFATNRTDATVMATTHALDHNNENDAINKIEAELGINPSGSYSTVLARLDGLATLVPSSTSAATAYTLVLGDAGQVKEFTAATAVTVTVPSNAAVAFPLYTIIGLLQYGAGQVTITKPGGVTLVSAGAKLKTTVQYSSVWLRKRAIDEWVVSGDLTT